MTTAHGILATFLLGLLLASFDSQAAPAECPLVGDVRECAITVGATEVVVVAGELDGGIFLLDSWLVDGVPQLSPGGSGYSIRDFTTSGVTGADLEVATLDAETGEVVVRFQQIGGPLALGVTFRVSDDGTRSRVTQELNVSSASIRTVSARAYAVYDFDLDGTPVDDSVSAAADGTELTQSDGEWVATTSVTDGAPPDGFEVAACCGLEGLILDADTFLLANNTSAPGPDDFQSALSWNFALPPSGSFTTTIVSSIGVPEPGAAAIEVVALLALTGIACRRKRTAKVAA